MELQKDKNNYILTKEELIKLCEKQKELTLNDNGFNGYKNYVKNKLL